MSDDASSGDRRPIQSGRLPGGNYDLYEGSNVVEIFVDGASGSWLGPSTSRAVFHTVTKVEPLSGSTTESFERREVALRLTMPTPQFLEFLLNTLSGFTANESGLLDAFDKQKEVMVTLLKRMKPNA